MSRTDKTNPGWVRAARGETEQFDHHTYECLQGAQPCTLPPKSPTIPVNHDRTGCFWYPTSAIGKGGQSKSLCGCTGMCTEQHRRKQENRRTRHGKRAVIAEQLA